MSKTDKTKPWRLKEKDHRVLYPRRTEPIRWPDRYWLGEMRCGCRMCTDYYGRKAARRKERYDGKRQACTWQTDM